MEAIELVRRSAKDFCRGSVTQDTAWSVVEFGGYAVEIGLVVGDVGAFGKYSRCRPLVLLLVPRS